MEREKKKMTSFFWDFTPTAIAMSVNVSDELFIFFWRPKATLNLLLITARMVTHIPQTHTNTKSLANIYIYIKATIIYELKKQSCSFAFGLVWFGFVLAVV